MSSNFWQHYQRSGYVTVADADGNDVRVELCKDPSGRLGIVLEGPAFGPTAGKLTADFGPEFRGFASADAARVYAEKYIS